MTHDSLRWLARAHGALAWLATLALLGAVAIPIVKAHAQRTSRAVLAVATVLLSAAFAAGLALDAPYRGLLRQRIFIEAPALGRLFERKTHLAFGALALAWCACACAFALDAAARPRAGAQTPLVPGAAELRRPAHLTVFASAVFALLASLFSQVVTTRYRF